MQSKSNDSEINIVAIVRDGHTHMFLYRDGQATEALRALGKAAADPATNFSWVDAAVLGEKVRQLQVESSNSSEVPNSSKPRF